MNFGASLHREPRAWELESDEQYEMRLRKQEQDRGDRIDQLSREAVQNTDLLAATRALRLRAEHDLSKKAAPDNAEEIGRIQHRSELLGEKVAALRRGEIITPDHGHISFDNIGTEGHDPNHPITDNPYLNHNLTVSHSHDPSTSAAAGRPPSAKRR